MRIQLGNGTVAENGTDWVDLRVAGDMDGRNLSVRAHTVNGAADGPTLWLQGTIHGDKQAPG